VPRVLVVRLPDGANANSLDALLAILHRFPGPTPVWVEIQDTILIEMEVGVNTQDDLLAGFLRTWQGIMHVPVFEPFPSV
jgi:hypothetical protein